MKTSVALTKDQQLQARNCARRMLDGLEDVDLHRYRGAHSRATLRFLLVTERRLVAQRRNSRKDIF